ncbi:Lysozyme domain protein [Candidatus Hepatincolaceae symbiont of Richtersius coronifer]
MQISSKGLKLIKKFEIEGSHELVGDILLAKIAKFEGYLNNLLQSFKLELNQNQFDALISFLSTEQTFSKPMLERFKGKAINELGECILFYNRKDGEVCPTLIARRNAEEDLFFQSKY